MRVKSLSGGDSESDSDESDHESGSDSEKKKKKKISSRVKDETKTANESESGVNSDDFPSTKFDMHDDFPEISTWQERFEGVQQQTYKKTRDSNDTKAFEKK
jgi:hypothetical protein